MKKLFSRVDGIFFLIVITILWAPVMSGSPVMHAEPDARLSDGSRKVIAISEVMPLKNGEYRTRDLIVWQTDRISPDGKVEGRFVLKNQPSFTEQAAIAQIPLPQY